MLSSEVIRGILKKSPFSMNDIAMILGIGKRTLYERLKYDKLTLNEINILLQLLNMEINQFCVKECDENEI